MTWGEVENTPLRVEGSETPYVDRTPGPAFKVGHGEGSSDGTLSRHMVFRALAAGCTEDGLAATGQSRAI